MWLQPDFGGATIGPQPLATPAPEPLAAVHIRVRLAEAAPGVSIHGYDLTIREHSEHGKTVGPPFEKSFDRTSSWEIRCQDGFVRAIQGGGKQSLELKAPISIESQGGFLLFHGKPYREEIRVFSNGSLCEVVNVLDLEKYLDGLVNAEFSSNWNSEAIAAQVVAARTYALYQIRMATQEAGSHFDVDATTKDQVYDGSIKEDYRASRSVDRTRGLVLGVQVAQNGFMPLKAFYHSTCGGVTELPENVWGRRQAGFKHPVRCPFCNHSPVFHWELDLNSNDITEALLRGGKLDGIQPGWPRNWLQVLRSGTLTDVQPGALDAAGRVSKTVTVWSFTNRLIELPVPGAKFREWIGAGKLRSMAFQIVPQRGLASNHWHLEGHGNGHGVGMCQWGAKIMGEKGYKMAAILRLYYPDAILRKLW